MWYWCYRLIDVLKGDLGNFVLHSVISVIQSCPTLCNLMDFSTPGFAIHHQLPSCSSFLLVKSSSFEGGDRKGCVSVLRRKRWKCKIVTEKAKCGLGKCSMIPKPKKDPHLELHDHKLKAYMVENFPLVMFSNTDGQSHLRVVVNPGYSFVKQLKWYQGHK